MAELEGINKIKVLLDWDSEVDLDVFTFLCCDKGVINDAANCVFYNSENREEPFDKTIYGSKKRWKSQTRPMSADGSVILSISSYYGEIVNVNLDKVDSNVSEIVFAAAIYNGDKDGISFGDVKDAYVSVINAENDEELCRYELKKAFTSETAVSVAKLIINKDGNWEFKATGMGHAGGVETLIDIYAS